MKRVYMIKLNEMAVKTGFADLVDAEAFTGTDEVNTIVETAHLYGVKVIASNHDFQKTPPKEEIVSRLCFMQECGADIVKIAVMPQSKKDVLTLLFGNGRDGEGACKVSGRYNVYVGSRSSQSYLR